MFEINMYIMSRVLGFYLVRVTGKAMYSLSQEQKYLVLILPFQVLQHIFAELNCICIFNYSISSNISMCFHMRICNLQIIIIQYVTGNMKIWGEILEENLPLFVQFCYFYHLFCPHLSPLASTISGQQQTFNNYFLS